MKVGTSYFSTRDIRHFKRDLKSIKESGFDYIIHTFSERDLEFFRDSVQEMVGLTQEYGLLAYADPWGVLRLFGGEAYSKWIYEYPDIRQIKFNGHEAYGACPNNPKTIELIEKWIETVASMGFDGIFWDEPHLDDVSCFCSVCQDLFLDKYDLMMNKAPFMLLKEFGNKSKFYFIEHVVSYARKLGLKNTLCLLPTEDNNWDDYAGIRYLDVLSIDPYPVVLGPKYITFMEKEMPNIVATAHRNKKEMEIWMQAFSLSKEQEGYVEDFFERMKLLKPDRIGVWSFNATSSMSYIRPERPGRVWKKIVSYLKGGMAERTKARDSKSRIRRKPDRGFKSHSLRND